MAPIIRMPSTIVTAVSTEISILQAPTLTPVAFAKFSSKVTANTWLQQSTNSPSTMMHNTADSITSSFVIAKILPNIQLLTSVVIPVVKDVTIIPIARELAEIIAMAASLLIRLFSVIRSRKKAASTTTGMDTFKGDHPIARAIESAPKDTCESPSPIIE